MSRARLLAAVAVAGTVVSPASASAAGAPGFATPAVASIFQVGFEPDLAIDPSPKTAGQIYTSTPFGFSTTQSFMFRSNDAGQSFHMVEGNVLGKLSTCVGGGDTEIQIDPTNGKIFFSDLQGLTNFSNSTSEDSGRTWTTSCTAVNGTGVDRQWIGLDTNGGKSAVGDAADAGRAYEDYDNTKQDTGMDNTLGNQLVMNESVDGIHYGSHCQAAGVTCPGPAAIITTDEGIPGNVVVDNTSGPYRHRVYAVHTTGDNTGVIVSWCSGKSGDATAAQVADDCTDPTAVNQDPAHVNQYWHDSVARAKGAYLTGNLFASGALDQAGNLYVTWAEYPTDKDGNENGPGAIKLAVSTDGGQHFGPPQTISPVSLGNNVMPWVTAGSAGRVGVAWYGAEQAQENGTFGPDTLDHGVWNVYYAQSSDATADSPHFTTVKVTDHPNKFGSISTQGLGGSPDRSLGDFMQVMTGLNGQAVISYVDDTSADRNPDYCQGCGQTPPEAAGPIMIAQQSVGTSLLASKPDLAGGDPPFGEITDPTGKGYPDAFLSANGTDTNATPNLDIAGVKVTQPDSAHVTISMTTADANLTKDLAVDGPTFGGSSGQWIVRWAAPQYDKPGDGNIFYVGMQAGQDGAPQFYTGTTCAIGTTHTKYFTYPTTTTVPGSVNGPTITWTVPLTAIGKPANGQSMFSVTGFTAVQPAPSSSSGSSGCSDPASGSGDPQIPNVIDAAPPFTYTMGGRAAAAPPAGTVGASGGTGTACSASQGLAAVKVRPRGRGLQVSYRRLQRHPVTIDVYEVAHGRSVLGMRLIARLRGGTSGVLWRGRANRRHRTATDGTYFVRVRMKLGRHGTDDRRVTLRRRGGRFGHAPAFFRATGCGLITYFKLNLPVFGGPHRRSLYINYRLRDAAKVTITVLRGRKVVHRWKPQSVKQGRVYRRLLAARHLRRGLYRVRLRVVEPGRTATTTLTAQLL